MLQKSSSFIHRTRHLNDPHKSDARHYYVSHHAADGKAKVTTLQRHGVDKDMIELSKVAQDDALREKEDRKRREEVEAQVLEAFRAATEGKPKQDPAAERRLKRDLRKLLMRRRSSGLKKKHLSFDRKWNEEYQALLDKVRHDTTRHDTTRHDTTRHDTTRHDTRTDARHALQGIWNMSANDAQEISNLMHDFVFNVETYAKVIINELNVDDSKYAHSLSLPPFAHLARFVLLTPTPFAGKRSSPWKWAASPEVKSMWCRASSSRYGHPPAHR
jgi:hypothetical protein